MTASCSSGAHQHPLVNTASCNQGSRHPVLVDMSGTAPGKRCPTCRAAGKEVWVFAGRSCPYCATYVE
ncbi:hypothetical protein GGR51DRAFT_566964 [Nemania sp. FL0031]|nr:hypothetical protein GGR51DRAFT_566964 [Nemania sp. FL0031]